MPFTKLRVVFAAPVNSAPALVNSISKPLTLLGKLASLKEKSYSLPASVGVASLPKTVIVGLAFASAAKAFIPTAEANSAPAKMIAEIFLIFIFILLSYL